MDSHPDAVKYIGMNGLEHAYQYIYDHQIPLEKVNAGDAVYQACFEMDRDKYSMADMTRTFQQMIDATLLNEYLPTNVLIPEGKRIYIRKWPCFMPERTYYHLDAMELHYVLQGQVTQTVNGQSMVLHTGDMCLIAPEANYSLMITDEKDVMFSIIIYTDMIREILDRMDLEEDTLSSFFSKLIYGQNYIPFLFCDIGVDLYIREIILDMMESQDAEGSYADRYMKTAFELLCLRLLRNHKSRIVAGNTALKRGTRITAIMDYAESHCDTVTLGALAKKYNYSYSYLSSVIKEHYGHSFREILSEIRMEKAACLLKTTTRSVSAISEMLGYGEKSHFFKVFKKKYHMTPEEFRQSGET